MSAGPLAEHGTTARAKGGARHNLSPCACPRCAHALHQYTRRLRYYEHVARTEYGARRPYDIVPAQPVRDHLVRLFNDGAGWVQIALAASSSQSTITRIVNSEQPDMRWTTACRLLAVRPADVTPPWRSVPAAGSTRRLRALACLGHYRTTMAAESGVAQETLGALLGGRCAVTSAATAARIATAYDRLRTTADTSARMRNRARREGWHGPLAWDDIDDPSAVPEADTTCEGPRVDALGEDWAELEAQGYSREQAAERLGVTRSYLDTAIARYRRALTRTDMETAA